MATDLEGKDVVEKGKGDVHGSGWEARNGEKAPGFGPTRTGELGLDLGGGEGW
jgi:hypothetical protein